MTRAQLAHVLRAAARDAGESDILVIGSQAILGSFDETELPEAAKRSVEADLVFYRSTRSTELADRVDGSIGELSQFHQSFAYYGQGAELGTARLPEGWLARVVTFDRKDAEPARPVCLEAHDLAVSKLAAMREKDREFVEALLNAGLLDLQTLIERARLLPPGTHRAAVEDWLERRREE